MIGLLIKLPKDEVERENFGGLPAWLGSFFFFFLKKMKARTAAPMRTTTAAVTPPAMAATGVPLSEVLAPSEAPSEAPVVALGSSAGLVVSAGLASLVGLGLAPAVVVAPGFAGLVCIGTAFWFWSITHCVKVLSHEYPNGQH
jgi:hypothetical protein